MSQLYRYYITEIHFTDPVNFHFTLRTQTNYFYATDDDTANEFVQEIVKRDFPDAINPIVQVKSVTEDIENAARAKLREYYRLQQIAQLN